MDRRLEETIDALSQRCNMFQAAFTDIAQAHGVSMPNAPLDHPELLLLTEKIAAEHRSLSTQRDALLAALQFMVDNIAQPVCLETRDGFESARALLAAAQAGAQ